jgi:hypothetical protein
MIIILFLYSQTINAFDADNVFKFAEHLYAQKDYGAALNEYRRYRFLADSLEPDLPEKIIDCLVHLDKYNEALIESNNIEDAQKREYIRGMIFFTAQEYDSSRSYLTDIKEPYTAAARKTMGLSYAYEFRFNEAGQFIDLPKDPPTYKKPALGALCALFPGGGHWYCGRIGDGVFSFFLISTSALLSYYYHHEDEEIKFDICLAATGLFYAANIYGGVNAVHNYNYYENEKYLKQIIDNNE